MATEIQRGVPRDARPDLRFHPDRAARREQILGVLRALMDQMSQPKSPEVQARVDEGWRDFANSLSKGGWFTSDVIALSQNFDQGLLPTRLEEFLRIEMGNRYIAWMVQDIGVVLTYGLADGVRKTIEEASLQLGYKSKRGVNGEGVKWTERRFMMFLTNPGEFMRRYR